MEACYGGVFLDDTSGDSRIIITSTDHAHWANPWKPNGQKTDLPVFSHHLFESLDDGDNFADAFNYARAETLDNNQYYGEENEYEKQYPWLDDNGNGVAVNASVPIWDGYGYDGYLAQNTYL